MADHRKDGAYKPSNTRDSDSDLSETPSSISPITPPIFPKTPTRASKRKSIAATASTALKGTGLSHRRASESSVDDGVKNVRKPAKNTAKAKNENPARKGRAKQDKPTSYIRCFPDIKPDDPRLLCGKSDRYWDDNIKKDLMEARLYYYIRPKDKKHIPTQKQKKKTKHDLLIGLKQIYFDRDEVDRWSAEELKSCTGCAGDEYEKTCRQDGRLPSLPTPDVKRAPRKAVANVYADGKSRQMNPAEEAKLKAEREDREREKQDLIRLRKENNVLKRELAERDEQKAEFENLSKKEEEEELKALRGLKEEFEHWKQMIAAGMTLPIPGLSQVKILPSEPLDERSRRYVGDTVRDALLSFTYHDLNRHPQAIAKEPVRSNIIAKQEDFRKVIPAAFSANSRIYLRFEHESPGYEPWNPHWTIPEEKGVAYPIRGRGPVWYDHSSAIDCVIVAGLLLDAGSTIADRKGDNHFLENLSRVSSAYLETVAQDWLIMTREQSIACRNAFWSLVNQTACQEKSDWEDTEEQNELWQIGSLQDPAPIWDLCTENFHQFRFSYTTRTSKCPECGYESESVPQMASSITLSAPADNTGTQTLEEALQRFFVRQEKCERCDANVVSAAFINDDLPPRLVVFPEKALNLTEHTTPANFSYFKSKKTPGTGTDEPYLSVSATYRWLGGIYFCNGHYRVYWNDHDRQERDYGYFKVYDGMCAEGVIVGELPAADEYERVPPDWFGFGTQSILFYEKVLAPTREVMEEVSTVLDQVCRGEKLLSLPTSVVALPMTDVPQVKAPSSPIAHLPPPLMEPRPSQMIPDPPTFDGQTEIIPASSAADLSSREEYFTAAAIQMEPELREDILKSLRSQRDSQNTREGVAAYDQIIADFNARLNRSEPGNPRLDVEPLVIYHPAAPSPEDSQPPPRLQAIEFQPTTIHHPGAPGETPPPLQNVHVEEAPVKHVEGGGKQPNPYDIHGTNTIVLYPPIKMVPSDYHDPSEYDPRIQHAPEPSNEEMFPERELPTKTARIILSLASKLCYECGHELQGTEYLAFTVSSDEVRYVHDHCFHCPRCHTGLNADADNAGIDREEIAIWNGPVPEFDDEAMCKTCADYLDVLEERKKQAEKQAAESKSKQPEDDRPSPKRTQLVNSGWAPINAPRTANELKIYEEGVDLDGGVHTKEEEVADGPKADEAEKGTKSPKAPKTSKPKTKKDRAPDNSTGHDAEVNADGTGADQDPGKLPKTQSKKAPTKKNVSEPNTAVADGTSAVIDGAGTDREAEKQPTSAKEPKKRKTSSTKRKASDTDKTPVNPAGTDDVTSHGTEQQSKEPPAKKSKILKTPKDPTRRELSTSAGTGPATGAENIDASPQKAEPAKTAAKTGTTPKTPKTPPKARKQSTRGNTEDAGTGAGEGAGQAKGQETMQPEAEIPGSTEAPVTVQDKSSSTAPSQLQVEEAKGKQSFSPVPESTISPGTSIIGRDPGQPPAEPSVPKGPGQIKHKLAKERKDLNVDVDEAKKWGRTVDVEGLTAVSGSEADSLPPPPTTGLDLPEHVLSDPAGSEIPGLDARGYLLHVAPATPPPPPPPPPSLHPSQDGDEDNGGKNKRKREEDLPDDNYDDDDDLFGPDDGPISIPPAPQGSKKQKLSQEPDDTISQ